MHPEGGSWTEVRTHTPSKFSKVLTAPLAPIPLDHSKFRENGSQPSPEPDVRLSPHPALRNRRWYYRCSGLLLESYAACLSFKPLSSQYSPKRHNTVSGCVAKYASALSTEAVNTANSLKYWLWVACFFVFFHRYSIGL